MAKFVIECPSCGRYAQARTGFFVRKKIDCTCGHTIDVRTDRLSSRVCPHCGNNVVFDQSKGEKAKCPVCREPINTMAEQDKTVEFACAQCGVRLRTAKGAPTYTCPVCDFVNDVAGQIKREEIRKDGLPSVIKYEGDNRTLVWKHPIEDFYLGSQLIVHESQEAIFFRDGQALDLFGAGRYTLETQKLPMLDKLYHLPTDTEGTFHSEVYYINLTTQMGVKWGTDTKVRMFDPASGLHVALGASGECNLRVSDSRRLLLKVVGTASGITQNELFDVNIGAFRSMVMTQVKSYLPQAIRESGINVLEIDERLMELSEALRDKINPGLAEYGLTMPEFYVSRIVTPDDDPNFIEMKRLLAREKLEPIHQRAAEATGRRQMTEAQTAAQLKIINAKGEAEALKIQKQAEAEGYQMQAAAEAAGMRMKGYTYQQETARQVGLAAMQNAGSGGGSSFSEAANVGVNLGAMSSVMKMTSDAISPVLEQGAQMGQTVAAAGWDCPDCGGKGISSNFCPNCGARRPAPAWTCPGCGTGNITSNFCPNCGGKRPAPKRWSCPDCGTADITTKFCPNCGRKGGE